MASSNRPWYWRGSRWWRARIAFYARQAALREGLQNERVPKQLELGSPVRPEVLNRSQPLARCCVPVELAPQCLIHVGGLLRFRSHLYAHALERVGHQLRQHAMHKPRSKSMPSKQPGLREDLARLPRRFRSATSFPTDSHLARCPPPCRGLAFLEGSEPRPPSSASRGAGWGNGAPKTWNWIDGRALVHRASIGTDGRCFSSTVTIVWVLTAP